MTAASALPAFKVFIREGSIIFKARVWLVYRSMRSATTTRTNSMLLVIPFVGYANVIRYMAWQNATRTRQDRYLYIMAREFPEWAKDTVERAGNQQGSSNVGQWRDAHPIQDIANP